MSKHTEGRPACIISESAMGGRSAERRDLVYLPVFRFRNGRLESEIFQRLVVLNMNYILSDEWCKRETEEGTVVVLAFET